MDLSAASLGRLVRYPAPVWGKAGISSREKRVKERVRVTARLQLQGHDVPLHGPEERAHKC